jgi:hypothetical protein
VNTNECLQIEVDVTDFAGATFESLTEKYRGHKPLVLTTDMVNLKGYTVLNIFAPLHAAFWSAPSFNGSLGACRDSVVHLFGSDAARDLFMKDMRLAKIRKTDPQLRLFHAYADILKISGRGVPNLGEGRLNYSEKWRFASVGVPTQLKQAALALLEREVAEFGKYAFFRIDESVHLTDPRRRSSVGSFVFHNIDLLSFSSSQERDQVKQEVLSELKWLVKRLEDGTAFDTPIEPIWMIKGQVGFYLMPAIDKSGPDWEDPLAKEILSYRARVVRRLGWPQQYHSVVRALSGFREQTQELELTTFSPYDVVAELEAYLDDMRRLYPVLEVTSFDAGAPV